MNPFKDGSNTKDAPDHSLSCAGFIIHGLAHVVRPPSGLISLRPLIVLRCIAISFMITVSPDLRPAFKMNSHKPHSTSYCQTVPSPSGSTTSEEAVRNPLSQICLLITVVPSQFLPTLSWYRTFLLCISLPDQSNHGVCVD